MYLFVIRQASENEEFGSETDRAPKFGIYPQKDKTLTANRIEITTNFPLAEKHDFAMKRQ